MQTCTPLPPLVAEHGDEDAEEEDASDDAANDGGYGGAGRGEGLHEEGVRRTVGVPAVVVEDLVRVVVGTGPGAVVLRGEGVRPAPVREDLVVLASVSALTAEGAVAAPTLPRARHADLIIVILIIIIKSLTTNNCYCISHTLSSG